MKPILFLDVDGVINACSQKVTDCVTFKAEGFTIRIRHHVPDCIRRLAEVYEVVWMTTWRDKAGPAFAHRIGLTGDEPYVPWDHMKIPALLQWACDRAFAFVDDDAEWELRRLGRSCDNIGGLIITPDVKVGLTEEHTKELLAYAESLVCV